MGSKVIAVGLFAAWAVHDLEEIVGTRYWRRKAIPRLRARYPTVPDAVWRTAEVETVQMAIAVSQVGVPVAVSSVAEARRKSDHDFREGAVRIVGETGKPIAQVARELGVNEGTLGNWVMLDRRRGDTGNGALGEDERAELARLRRECAELRMRFAMETASFPDADRLWVERALELAARLHAARAASAAAATPLMTLGLPIAASASARSTTIPATLMVWAG